MGWSRGHRHAGVDTSSDWLASPFTGWCFASSYTETPKKKLSIIMEHIWCTLYNYVAAVTYTMWERLDCERASVDNSICWVISQEPIIPDAILSWALGRGEIRGAIQELSRCGKCALATLQILVCWMFQVWFTTLDDFVSCDKKWWTPCNWDKYRSSSLREDMMWTLLPTSRLCSSSVP